MPFPIPENRPGGDTSFLNNVPQPVLSGEQLPAFTYPLGASEGRRLDGSYGKEVTVRELPVSTGIAGVAMLMQPGVMRELHWHATAAEWAFVLRGRVRTTVVDPAGHAATDDFEPGDVWYFPRGHPHVLETLGDEPCEFVLIFDNGHFSEFGTFSISDWMAQVPRDVLARSLRVPESALTGLPAGEVYFAKGDRPPVPAAAPRGGVSPPALAHRYRLLAQRPDEVRAGGREWMVDRSRFPISTTMTGVYFELDPGGMRELHWHPNADEWQYVVAGRLRVTLFGAKGRYRQEEVGQGDVAYIPQGYGHSIENLGDGVAHVLIGLNAGTYQKIDLSGWVAGQPDDVLATNLSLPAGALRQMPRRDLFLTDGGAGDG